MRSRERLLLEFAELCAMIGLDAAVARRWLEDGSFPAPEPIGDGPCWDPATVWTWCAAEFPEIAAAAPLQCWRSNSAELVESRDLGGAGDQDWQVARGVRLRVVWPLITGDQFAWTRAAELEPLVPQLVVVGNGTYHPEHGPDIIIHRCRGGRHAGADPRARPSWRDLAAALGGTAPWWPRRLRVGAAIQAWRPGAHPALVDAVPDFDVAPLLRLADTMAPDRPAHRVVVEAAVAAQVEVAEGAAGDIAELLDAGLGDIVEIAAEPVAIVPVDPLDDELQHRAGWWEILESADPLALEVARAVRARGNLGVPHSRWMPIEVAGSVSREWAGRLAPARRTGAHELLVDDPGRVVECLVDPLSGVAVVRLRDGWLRAAIPDRLPARTPLAALEFEAETVWVRVADGAVYPMPGEDLSYGPEGNYGPLAVRKRSFSTTSPPRPARTFTEPVPGSSAWPPPSGPTGRSSPARSSSVPASETTGRCGHRSR
ncbi:hypothetical protein IU436_30620 [Nocardia farcinica]|uniref:hypothetical protein n=1 Tax=Nocardia TaxID=1817 RepID=UPI00189590FD|nr:MULTISPECIES: hypothetical protein [Nocardia]MBF6216151.1 hypothetical protein [Nocardia puris]MBF6422929.1 hypothetical protein [Nocardia farcinica]MBF6434664.1 hypothetical protein [Nocardia farcinica]MBF6505769.1 hypothetical protein [Nocardia farcinica]